VHTLLSGIGVGAGDGGVPGAFTPNAHQLVSVGITLSCSPAVSDAQKQLTLHDEREAICFNCIDHFVGESMTL
tara:strand:+ start:541 stop:759 length:219 start_codon:yes stop_codon:yes gene_type:complete